jgi:hypothetical protein
VKRAENMKPNLAPLYGVVCVVLVAGCSSVPMQPEQDVRSSFQSGCDNAQVARVQSARQPILVERYWVNCPAAPISDKSSS